MYKYIIKRLLLLIPVLIGVSLVVFVMLEITPGDPARQLAGSDASEEAVEQLREEMGLNDPAPTRFIRYIWNACHGDLGKSYTTKAPVVHEIMSRFPTTFTLACLSTLIAGVTGILLGIISATHQYSFLDCIRASWSFHAGVLAGNDADCILFGQAGNPSIFRLQYTPSLDYASCGCGV